MIAVLKEITVRAILRPKYNNKRVENFILWSIDNEDDIKGYYLALGKALPDAVRDGHLKADGDAHRYMNFVQAQWDRARGAF